MLPWHTRYVVTDVSHATLRTEGLVFADIYEGLEHEPYHPEVQASYESLLSDLYEQYEHVVEHLDIIMSNEDTYEGHAQRMFEDIDHRRRLEVLTSDDSMSSLPRDHPMNGIAPNGMLWNTIFRAVHDAYGHHAGYHAFTDSGERSAWVQHMLTLSPESYMALFCETRGQNAWTNHYGIHADLPVRERPFPYQKAGLVDFNLFPLNTRKLIESLSESPSDKR